MATGPPSKPVIISAIAIIIAVGLFLMWQSSSKSSSEREPVAGDNVAPTAASIDSAVASAPPVTTPSAVPPADGSADDLQGWPLDVTGALGIAQSDDTIPGSAEFGDSFGGSLAAGDINGDGVADLVLGSPGESIGDQSGAGGVHVVLGGDFGPGRPPAVAISQANEGVAGAAEVDDGFGTAIEVADFNGDGFGDIAIGSPGEALGEDAQAGVIHIVVGSTLGAALAESVVIRQDPLPGVSEAGDEFGFTLAAADFNGDGLADLAIGVPGEAVGEAAQAGFVNVLDGTPGGLDSDSAKGLDQADVGGEVDAQNRFGEALASGDFNNDGFDDLAIASPGLDSAAGLVTVVVGTPNGLGTSIGFFLQQGEGGLAGSPGPGDRLGAAMAVGDFNNDGFDDLAIGVPGEGFSDETSAGAVAVLHGDPLGFAAQPLLSQADLLGTAESSDRFGAALGAGDLNGDGFADLAIGSPGEGIGDLADVGAIHILEGSADGLTTDRAAQALTRSALPGAPEAGDNFAAQIEIADITGDGVADIIVGAPSEAIGEQSAAGIVHVIPGRSAS